jgi:hypothetical protein
VATRHGGTVGAALVSEILFGFVVFLALLLVMFVYTVITASPRDVIPAEEPDLSPAALAALTGPPSAPAPVLPVRLPQAHTSPAGSAGRSGGADHAARYTPVAAPVTAPPRDSGGPPPRPALASILGAAGLAIAVAGGWLFLHTCETATAVRTTPLRSACRDSSCPMAPSSSAAPSPWPASPSSSPHSS